MSRLNTFTSHQNARNSPYQDAVLFPPLLVKKDSRSYVSKNKYKKVERD